MKKLILLFILSHNFLTLFSQYDATTDREALIALYTATDGKNWNNPWDLTEDISSWSGVRTDLEGRVTNLNLANQNLQGFLPQQLGDLTSIFHLDLSNNNLIGNIPDVWDELTELVFIYLHKNQLEGPIPQSAGSLPKLRRLYVHENNLSGTLSFEPNLNTEYAIARNNFVFEDFEQLLIDYPTINISYSNQGYIGEEETISVSEEGRFEISVTETISPNNTYQWRKDGRNIEAATNASFVIENVFIEDVGRYDCVVNNGVATRLFLIKNTVTLVMNDDYDFDGIPDYKDSCPNTPEGEEINVHGCSISQLDDDGDGIYNHLDDCPDTTIGVSVDENGCSSEQQNINNDRASLIAIYNALDGQNWRYKWNLNEPDLEKWFGISLNSKGRVEGIYLQSNDLKGTIPSEIKHLTYLNRLNLVGNDNVYGEIPIELFNLSNLWELKLNINSLSGQLSPNISKLKNLKILRLNNNRFLGSIPPELGQLQNIELISLGINNFSGEIPPEIGQLHTLKGLDLGINKLTGEIPSELGMLNELLSLDLGANELVGQIPKELSQMERLANLRLSNNKLSGSIPIELGLISTLGSLRLSSNQLSGSIPTELSTLPDLYWLDVAYNQISGVIPPKLGQLKKLQYLYLYGNNLAGNIPSELSQMDSLRDLFLYKNQLDGNIPDELGTMPNLNRIWLQENKLEGQIPNSLTNLSTLTSLDLSDNMFSGEVPAFNHNLDRIKIEQNRFVFEDIEAIIANQSNIFYEPQEDIGEVKVLDFQAGDSYTIVIDATTSSNNSYQWRKNGQLLNGANNATLTINPVISPSFEPGHASAVTTAFIVIGSGSLMVTWVTAESPVSS